MAVYARPHFINEKTVAFIMADGLMHKTFSPTQVSILSFHWGGPSSSRGSDFYLTSDQEEKDSDLVNQLQRKNRARRGEPNKQGQRYVVYFKVNKVLPLIGAK